MKRFLTLVLIALFCGASYAQNKIELNLTKGQVYRQKMSMVMAIKQTISSREMLINMTLSGTTAYTVTDFKNGVYDIDIAYKTLAVKTEIPGGKSISFDSEKQDKSDTVSTSLSMMKDKPFHVKMNKQGKLLAVSDFNNLYAAVFSKFPKLTPLQRQKIQAHIEQSFGEKAIKNNLQNMMGFYPQKPISKGGKWSVNSTTSSANMEMQLNADFTLDDVTASQYVISGVSKMTNPDAAEDKEINGMSAKSTITGDITTKMKVNKKTGWIEESIANLNLKGTISFKPTDKMPKGMTIPMNVSAKTTLSGN